MSYEIKTLLTVLTPALIASGFLIAARRGGRSGTWGASAGSAIGFGAGQWLLVGLPGFPPVDVTHWPIFLALFAGILGVVEALWAREPRLLRWLARVALVAAVACLLLWPMIRGSWTRTQSVGWIFGIALAASIAFGNLSALIERLPAPASSSTLFLPVLALMPLLTFSHSALLGQLGLLAASALFPAVVLAWWGRDPAPIRGVLPVALALEESLLVAGYFFSDDLTPFGVLALVLAPLVAWLGAFGPLKRWRPRLLGLAVAVLVAIPIGVVVGLAARSYIAGLDEGPEVRIEIRSADYSLIPT